MSAVVPVRSRTRVERRDLWIGLATSLAVHLVFACLWLVAGVVVMAVHSSAVREELPRTAADPAKQEVPAPREEPPLLFVEVLPQQATPEPPKDAKFYSYANSVAANPDAQVETTVPKINGTQDKVPKTFDNLQPPPEDFNPVPLMPSPPPDKPEPAPEPVAANPPQPKPAEPERPQPRGDLALAKPTPAPEPTPAEPAPRPRARTLVEARTRQGLMTGEKMRQEGGVRRRALMSSLDVKATPFGAYDAAVIAAIQKRWYDLLDESSFAPRTGKVAIEFRMHYDGRITDLKIVEVEPGVGELLALYCRRAISDPAPFAPWPSDMRRMIGRDYRDVKFSFFYL